MARPPDFDRAVDLFLQHLKVERNLSANTIEAYSRDLARLGVRLGVHHVYLPALLKPAAQEALGPENVGYLSGFTGSTAALLITADRSLFITDSRYAAQVERAVAEEDLGARVRLPGSLTGAALDEEWRSSDLLVLPSRKVESARIHPLPWYLWLRFRLGLRLRLGLRFGLRLRLG